MFDHLYERNWVDSPVDRSWLAAMVMFQYPSCWMWKPQPRSQVPLSPMRRTTALRQCLSLHAAWTYDAMMPWLSGQSSMLEGLGAARFGCWDVVGKCAKAKHFYRKSEWEQRASLQRTSGTSPSIISCFHRHQPVFFWAYVQIQTLKI